MAWNEVYGKVQKTGLMVQAHEALKPCAVEASVPVIDPTPPSQVSAPLTDPELPLQTQSSHHRPCAWRPLMKIRTGRHLRMWKTSLKRDREESPLDFHFMRRRWLAFERTHSLLERHQTPTNPKRPRQNTCRKHLRTTLGTVRRK